MKSVAFVDGETLTYVQGERSWITAAGFKGSRMFYRKALLSCGGRVWQNGSTMCDVFRRANGTGCSVRVF